VPIDLFRSTTLGFVDGVFFRSCPAAAACGCGAAGVRLKMATLKHRRWSSDGESGMISRLRQREAADMGPGRHGEDTRLICHNDMCLAAHGWPGLWLKKS
jgi:hypothetical protein